MATLNVHPVMFNRTASGLAQRVASTKELKIAELAVPGGAPWCDFGRRSKVPNLSRFEASTIPGESPSVFGCFLVYQLDIFDHL